MLRKEVLNMKYSDLLTDEELDFALDAYAVYQMYKYDSSRKYEVSKKEFDSDDCQMIIEDACIWYLNTVHKYMPTDIYNHLKDLKSSILKKLSDEDDKGWIEDGYYLKPYSYGSAWVKD